VVGFSLGGNIVLKLAGEAAERSVEGLERVAALAPPVDFERCAALLAAPRNRFYEQYFVRGLLDQVRQRRRFFREDAAIRFPRRLTMRQFDDLYTSPRCGFDGATHYYRSAACLPVLQKISVPTLILTARDDPFITADPLERLATPPSMEVLILDRGGHLGFLGRSRAGGFRWAEQRIGEWVVGKSAP
jgi:predicted alpha/beta-fold hydrolase